MKEYNPRASSVYFAGSKQGRMGSNIQKVLHYYVPVTTVPKKVDVKEYQWTAK